ncbi:hypothetical protein WN944_014466 [Citrus x changshan-huyou]|uniref:Uncharacterized protein n=1 Tax=Citrus x changshan-huyou TaxID=2935761 RepID=A0AAP0QIR4_9ROSI
MRKEDNKKPLKANMVEGEGDDIIAVVVVSECGKESKLFTLVIHDLLQS